MPSRPAQRKAGPLARLSERICLNFMRPDVGRPGHHDFIHRGEWLVEQFAAMGVRWNRLAFSWVQIQPEPERFDWSAYDRVVNACCSHGINILATLGGHFDRPPVPAWAGTTLHQVINEHPEYLERFVEAWVKRYHDRIRFWEILNEPKVQHFDLTVLEYVERILKPAYRIIKRIAPESRVLPCAYNNLPPVGNWEDFWEPARGHYDIGNHHQYHDWEYFRTDTVADGDEADTRHYRTLMDTHGERAKPFWVTEVGWWGTGNLTGGCYDLYKRFPGRRDLETRPWYTGRDFLDHPIVAREDQLRARWMRDMFPRLLSIRGCDKVFLWVSLDEFEDGFDPARKYGRQDGDPSIGQVDLWGIIAGDGTWRTSAHALKELLAGRKKGRGR